MKLEISEQIFEKYSYIKFIEHHPVGPSCSMRTDEGTDMRKKLIVAFSNFVKAPKTVVLYDVKPEKK
jgi:hypothetical protein